MGSDPRQAGSRDLRALVTGASSGIGAGFVRALRARGERLVLVARRAERLQELVREQGGEANLAAIPLDLQDPGAPARLQAEMERRGFEIDLLVNCAGFGDTGRFTEEPVERALGMLDLNVRALVELTRRFLPGMIERRRGRLVNVVSTAAFQPVPYLAVYAASKAFVLSFTEGLAGELEGSGVIVQALCPGLTATEFQQVAGTDRVRFNRTGAMTPEQVVATSLRGLERGRLRVVPGLSNRLLAGAQRFLPVSVVRRVARELFKPEPGR